MQQSQPHFNSSTHLWTSTYNHRQILTQSPEDHLWLISARDFPVMANYSTGTQRAFLASIPLVLFVDIQITVFGLEKAQLKLNLNVFCSDLPTFERFSFGTSYCLYDVKQLWDNYWVTPQTYIVRVDRLDKSTEETVVIRDKSQQRKKWNCPSCGTLNFSSKTVCRNCGRSLFK